MPQRSVTEINNQIYVASKGQGGGNPGHGNQPPAPGPTGGSGGTGATGPTASPAQTIDIFVATPSAINQGGSDVLSWSTSNAVAVLLDGAAVAKSGAVTEAPAVTTTHTLVASGSAPNVTRQLTVTVTPTPPPPPPPPPATGSYMPPAASLVDSDGTWTLSQGNQGPLLLNSGQTFTGDGSPVSVALGGVGALMDDTMFLGAFNQPLWYCYTNLPAKPPFNLTTKAWYDCKLGITHDNYPNRDQPSRIQAPDLAYVGPSNTPDWEVDFTDLAAIQARMGYPIMDPSWNSVIYGDGPGNTPQFGTDAFGVNYMRFRNGLATNQLYPNTYPGSNGPVILALFLFLGNAIGAGKTQVSTRYLMWLEDDVQTGMTEIGVKLPGPTTDTPYNTGYTGGLMSWRMFHAYPMDNTFPLQDYLYNYQHNNFPGQIDDFGMNLKTGRWYVIEQRAVCNTFTGSAPNADGYAAIKINGNIIYEDHNMMWRSAADWAFNSFHLNFYHGGTLCERSAMHYRIANVAFKETDWVGVPAVLLPTPPATPAWLTGKTKDTVYSIASTANMPGNMAGPFGGSPITGGIGKSSADIDTWNGFAADYTNDVLYGVANGGDKQQWSNKVFKVDLLTATPQFNQVFAGSTENTAVVLTPGNNTYYTDGLPKARQSYYNNHFIPSLNGVVMILESAQFCNASTAGSARLNDVMDFYNTSTNLYSPAATYPKNGVASGLTTTLVSSVAKHPTTQEIYASDNFKMMKWSPVTGNWTTFANPGPGWTFRGSVIDANRNRWVWCAAGTLQFANLTTAAITSLAVTGDSNFTTDSSGDYLALIHDTDNDRYLLFTGNTSQSLPGRIYKINPTTGVCSKIADIAAPANGWNTRVHFFANLGVVVWLGDYSSNIGFMPTR